MRHIVVACVLAAGLHAQVASRTAQIESLRRDKAGRLVPETRSLLDRRMTGWSEAVMNSLTYGIKGLGLRFGGLPTGQGFALGPQYTRYGLADGKFLFRGSAAASAAGAYMFDLQFGVPELFSRSAFLDLVAVHGNYPRIDYYGPGPDSSRNGRSHFRFEETRYDVLLGVRLGRRLSLGFTGGYLSVNAGRGNRADIAHTADLFTEQDTPGLERQTDFARGGFFTRLDYRDDPIGARSGGMFQVRWQNYSDVRSNRFDFRQLDLEARQYVPFFNKRRVIALALAGTLSYPGSGAAVPFYLQPTLGGSDDLRGFRSYRFYGDNLLAANVEYRWEAFSGLDMALFLDAGKVAARRSQVNFHGLETSAGFGFRFNARNRNFIRIDTGFSHEGVQVWLKFGAPPEVRTREIAMSGRL